MRQVNTCTFRDRHDNTCISKQFVNELIINNKVKEETLATPNDLTMDHAMQISITHETLRRELNYFRRGQPTIN